MNNQSLHGSNKQKKSARDLSLDHQGFLIRSDDKVIKASMFGLKNELIVVDSDLLVEVYDIIFILTVDNQ